MLQYEKGNEMFDNVFSDDVKFWLIMLGYVGGTLVLCGVMYKWFAAMVGKEVAKALLTAGVIAIA